MFNDENPFGGGGPASYLNQIMQNMGAGIGPHMHRRPPEAYNEYMKAYSVAMLPGKERMNVSYGGKIIMPPSALAHLTELDLESPWMFKLSNPQNPAATTHAGVLEFIAEEGCVHLPYWMMKSLRLNEGDPVRITGTELPKGKFVKLQPQSVHFLEISDPKAVLEHALRNFSTLTQGDIIQISYNTIVFDLLIMETKPGGVGINILDTDLEVDFAAPVGYKEPERPKAAPPPTMASKLKIDLNDTTPVGSRPSSSLSGAFAGTTNGETSVSKGGEKWESFKGRGETLNGRKTKGKGISHRGVELIENSRLQRTDKRRIVTNDTFETSSTAPAPLNLPHGKLFFGFKAVPFTSDPQTQASGSSGSTSVPSTSAPSFSGSGNTLSGRSGASSGATAGGKGKGKEKEKTPGSVETSSTGGSTTTTNWGAGQTLSGSGRGSGLNANAARHAGAAAVSASGARISPSPSSTNTSSNRKPRTATSTGGGSRAKDAPITVISDSDSEESASDNEYDPDVIYVDSD